MPTVIAMFQGYAESANLEANVQKMKVKMLEGKKMGADVIVFPELFTTGYTLSQDCMKELAEKKDGKTFLELSQHARETDIAVLYGYPELVEIPSGNSKEKIYYNSAQFIDKSGKSLANYHKTHPWIEEDNVEGAFRAGESFSPVFEFCGVKIGLLICFDVEFCEAVRTLALQGAEVILVPTACNDSYDNMRIISEVIVAVRALENRVHVAYVNHCGGKFGGLSRCCGPVGNTLVSAGIEEEGIFLAQIDPRSVNEPNNYSYLNHRRPDLYRIN